MPNRTGSNSFKHDEVKRVQRYREELGAAYRILERRNTMQRKYGWNYFIGHYRGIGMDAIGREVKKLREKIHRWNHEYYAWAAPSVSDAEYDRALARLQQLEAQCPELADSNSPTARVGSPEVSTFPKVKHKTRMLSLEKAHSAEGVSKFFGKGVEGVVEPKVDGASLALTYYRGELVQAVTRGDGTTGDDVTLNARTIRSIPLVLPKAFSIEVRGEVYMKWSDFDAYNKELEAAGDEPAANPRNAAAGALKLKESKETATRPLSFMAYSVVGEIIGCKTYDAVLEELETLGFSTTSALPLPTESCENMTQFGVDLSDAGAVRDIVARLDKARKVQNFPTDGLVFKVNSLADQVKLGAGATGPKWAIAFKYPPEQVKATIRKINVTVGKTGKLTPVAEFKPVHISGSTVTFASLCNQNEINRLNVNIGDDVLIEKSSEIIPKIVGLVAKRSKGTFLLPKKCPCCRSETEQPKGLVDYYCFGPKCADQIKARLIHATGKAALDIDGCGEGFCVELMQQGVTTISDLLTTIPDLDPSSAARKKFLEEREKAKQKPFWRKLHAFCIEGIGKSTCQEIAARWPTMMQLVTAVEDNAAKVREVIGKVNYVTLMNWIAANEDEVARLYDLKFLSEKPAEDDKAPGRMAGKSVCVTGDLCITRDKIEQMVLDAGGLFKSSVSKKVDYLVVGENGGANKARDAARLGTKCLTEDEFWDLMGFKPKPDTKVDPEHDY